MRSHDPDPGNLWLARILWDSGAVRFGEFNIGATQKSPIYVNVRRMISNPRAMIYPHPRAHEHEVYAEIEGTYYPGQSVLLVDDLITGGTSIVETAATLREAGLQVHNAVVLLDRQAGGATRLRAAGIRLHSLLRLESLVNYLVSRELITQAQYAQCLTHIEMTEGS
jgi:orotate phosphoribosyltransferase